MDKAAPLSTSDFAALMRPIALAENEPVAIAVSGGPDSMALAFCLLRYMKEEGLRYQQSHHPPLAGGSKLQGNFGEGSIPSTLKAEPLPENAEVFSTLPQGKGDKHNLLALIVEHGLRDESAREAQEVAEQLRGMGIETEILPWVHDKVKSRVHVRARDARYALLRGACDKRGIKTLFVAHHADDQAETILMRFAKGSGIDGLAGMESETEKDGLRIVRPFLAVRKAALIATCEANNIAFVTDPSNEADKYARGRLRRVMPLLEGEGLTHERLIDMGERVREAKLALDFYTHAFLKDHAVVLPGSAVRLDLVALRGLPQAVALRSLTLLLLALHKSDYPPERKMLLPFCEWLRDQDEGGARTLHGCLVQKGEACDKATFLRELASITDRLPIAAGESVLWDGRWRVTCSIDVDVRMLVTQGRCKVLPPCGEGFRKGGERPGDCTKHNAGDVAPPPYPSPRGGGDSKAACSESNLHLDSFGQSIQLEIRPLGVQTHDLTDALAPGLRGRVPQGRVRACLPALWQGDELLAIPSFHVEDQGVIRAVRSPFPWE